MYITILLTGSRIGDIGGYAFREVLEEGIGEHEVALHTTRAMVREIASTYPQTDIMDSKSKFCFLRDIQVRLSLRWNVNLLLTCLYKDN